MWKRWCYLCVFMFNTSRFTVNDVWKQLHQAKTWDVTLVCWRAYDMIHKEKHLFLALVYCTPYCKVTRSNGTTMLSFFMMKTVWRHQKLSQLKKLKNSFWASLPKRVRWILKNCFILLAVNNRSHFSVTYQKRNTINSKRLLCVKEASTWKMFLVRN